MEAAEHVRALKHRAKRAVKARIALARKSPPAFNEFVLRDEETGGRIQNPPHQYRWNDLLEQHRRLVLWSHIDSGKALDVETPVPTPTGWTTMGALRVGDTVFDSKGKPCAVTFVTPFQYGRAVYRVRFDDGSEILADADHRWLAATFDDRRAGTPSASQSEKDGELCACGCGMRVKAGKRFVHNHHTRIERSAEGWRTVTTAEILRAGLYRVSGARKKSGELYEQYKWRIPLARAVEYAERELPVHPYVLGAWLGDGTSNAPNITAHEDDMAIVDRCNEIEGAEGHRTRSTAGSGKVFTCRIGKKCGGPQDERRLGPRLRKLGVMGKGRKHIPAEYLTASIAQRRELLAGLLDTDGSVSSGKSSRIELSFCNERLAMDAIELIRSLGFKARIAQSDAKIKGRIVGQRWRITFTANEPVFWLPRKLANQKLKPRYGRTGYRSIVAIEPIATRPVRCITVDSEDHSYLAGRDYTVTHNTNGVSVGRSLFELGKNHDLRICIVSATEKQALKILTAIKGYIERSPELRQVFPSLVPGTPWTATTISVKRKSLAKDPSVQVCGVHGAVLGSRIDLLILDDVLRHETTKTPAQRAELLKWFKSTIAGRLTKSSRVWALGTAWFDDDLLHMLAKTPGYKSARFPVANDNGESNWPEHWPVERILEMRAELGPLEAARQLDCLAQDESTQRCKPEWVKACLARGAGVPLVHSLRPEDIPPGAVAYTGVDLGVKQNKAAAKTVIFTILSHANGDRQVLDIQAGKWGAPEIINRILDTHDRYGSVTLVETNGAQDFLLQLAHEQRPDTDMTIIPFTTGGNKTHPVFGVEGVFSEFAAKRWIIPSDESGVKAAHVEIADWLAQCLSYDPARHSGDSLMAGWFSREGARRGAQRAKKGVAVRVLGAAPPPAPPTEEAAELDGWGPALESRRSA